MFLPPQAVSLACRGGWHKIVQIKSWGADLYHRLQGTALNALCDSAADFAGANVGERTATIRARPYLPRLARLRARCSADVELMRARSTFVTSQVAAYSLRQRVARKRTCARYIDVVPPRHPLLHS